MSSKKRARTDNGSFASKGYRPSSGPTVVVSTGRRYVRTARKSGPEVKFVTTLFNAGTVLANGGSVTALNLCSTGTDNSNRIGRRAQMKSVRFKGWMTPAGTGTNGPITLALVWDRQVNGALPLYTDIFSVATGIGVSGILNPDQNRRFKVVRSMDIVNNYSAAGVTQGDSANGNVSMFDFYADLTRLGETEFLGTAATIASIDAGALYFVQMNSAAVGGAAAGPAFNAQSIVKFTDA